ncbi:hypothetical protein HYX07_04020 [Candidatus Woesearchaeota archaeon]|nr:hypothetical protein [Candidatus Woesearchaeota archaeon]
MKQINGSSTGISKYEYDRRRFPLAEIVAQMFSMPVEQLERLHEALPQGYKMVQVADQLHVPFHRTFYDHVNPNGKNGFAQCQTSLGREFLDTYDLLARELIKVHLTEPSYFQVIPILRIQIPKNVAIVGRHRDADGDGRHHPDEVNVFLPVTDTYRSNTIWAESERDKKDFAPLEAKVGELIVWDGANLLHENRANDTGISRVSFDFRLWPFSKYVRRDGVYSLIMGVPMVAGGYFKS